MVCTDGLQEPRGQRSCFSRRPNKLDLLYELARSTYMYTYVIMRSSLMHLIDLQYVQHSALVFFVVGKNRNATTNRKIAYLIGGVVSLQGLLLRKENSQSTLWFSWGTKFSKTDMYNVCI